jgi:hypothetical protein
MNIGMNIGLKYIVILLFLLIATFILLDWWWAVVVCFGWSFFVKLELSQIMRSSFIAPASIWLSKALISDIENSFQISGLIAGLFGNLPGFVVYFVLAIVIGIPCMFASIAGHWTKKSFIMVGNSKTLSNVFFILLIFGVIQSGTAFSQQNDVDTISQRQKMTELERRADLEASQVEIIKQFEATLGDANIVPVKPVIPYIIPIARTYKYEVTSVPITLSYPAPEINVLSVFKDAPFNQNKFFLRGGYGSMNNPFGQVRWNKSSIDKFSLDVSADFLTIDNSQNLAFQKMTDFGIKTALQYRIGENMNLHAGINFNREDRFFYFTPALLTGDELSEDLLRRIDRIGWNAGISNIEHLEKGFNYQVQLSQEILNVQNFGGTETNTKLFAWVEKRNSEKINIEIPFTAQHSSHKTDFLEQNFYTVEIKPVVNFHTGGFQAGIGGVVMNDNYKTRAFPKLELAHRVYKNVVQAFVGLTQGFHTNNLSHTMHVVPWGSPEIDSIRNIVTREYFFGIRGELSFISYQGRSGYRQFSDLPLYQSLSDFGLVSQLYENVNAVFVSGNLDFAFSETLNLGGNMILNFYSPEAQAEMWGIPALELNAYAKFKPWGEKFLLKPELYLADRVQTLNSNMEIITLNNLVELNAIAEYFPIKNLGIFAGVNNLLDNPYQRWYGYPMVGINVMAGVNLIF